MLSLRCAAQNYDWGRLGENSEVAKLARANGNEVDEAKPFAELWMGAHPNCPSKLQSTGVSLQECLEKYPQLLGKKVQEHFGTQLPFLFKVLSVAKALSIQSHPNKELAARLHAEHPKLYADPNHKPEMALALADFEALCGFASTPELQSRLASTPELAELVGEERVASVAALRPGAGAEGGAEEDEKAGEEAKPALRAAFTALMTAPPDAVTSAVRRLVERLRGVREAGRALTPHEALALRLNDQFPDDVGIFSAFFLNLISLPPGSAIYLPANEPHAYLAGELVECMAASDNVIRAGLTPKFKHADVLCASLTYTQGPPPVLSGSPAGPPGLTVYRPPFEEFEIQRLEVAEGGKAALPASQGPRILLVQAGAATASAVGPLPAPLAAVPELESGCALRRGSILLLAPGVELAVQGAEEPLVAWVAAVNANFFALQDARRGAGQGAEEEVKEAVLAA